MYINVYIWNLKKYISSISGDLIYKRNRDTCVENKSMDTKGGCGEWDGLGGWDGICALLIECTSEDLL